MKSIFSLYLFGVFCLLIACGTSPKPADKVILGGTIYTVDDSHPIVEAVVINGDKIEFGGREYEAWKYICENTEVIDLEGKTMTPGFIEGHGHFMRVGYNELALDMMYVKS